MKKTPSIRFGISSAMSRWCLAAWFCWAVSQPCASIAANLAGALESTRIDVQPVSVTNTFGQDATFRVEASGPGTLFYQWHFGDDEEEIPGATNATLRITNATFAHVGIYFVRVFTLNPFDDVDSHEVALVVQPDMSLAGSIDPGFPDSIVWSVQRIVRQPDGRLLVGGSKLARLFPDGSADPSFAPEIQLPEITALALQPDGKVVVGFKGVVNAGGCLYKGMLRLTADGALDSTFRPHHADYELFLNYATSALAVQSDGQILVSGQLLYAGHDEDYWLSPGLHRLQPDGSVDSSLEYIGSISAKEILVLPNGYLVAGHSGLIRLLPNGRNDPSFTTVPAPIEALVVQPDGKLVIGGSFEQVQGQVRSHVARLNAQGELDLTFQPPVINDRVLAIAVQPDGKILIGGKFRFVDNQRREGLARLNLDGTLDASFVTGAGLLSDESVFAVRALEVLGTHTALAGGMLADYMAFPVGGYFSFSLGSLSWPLEITSYMPLGAFTLTNTFTNGVLTMERADAVEGPWQPVKSVFTTTTATQLSLTVTGAASFYRAQALDLSRGQAAGFTNLTLAYGLLTTIAGAGGPKDANNWRSEFEGGPATNAVLSGPHIAIADRTGQIFIADKDAHAVRMILLDGTIITAAGVNAPGNGADEEMAGTECAMNGPNGLWINRDGTVFIVDTGNRKVRRLASDGTIRTLFTASSSDPIQRGLWVSEDETVAYVTTYTAVKKWTKDTGLTDFSTGYLQLGNIAMDPWGSLVVTDRSAHRVYRLDSQGNRTPIAGNGSTTGGGDGQPAIETGLEEVRGVWFLPSGAYFLCTHRGSRVWYVDTAGLIHLFLNGHRSETHAGDGTWFYNPTEYRVSECRAVTVDHEGNLLITENDNGYVRKVQFLPYAPGESTP